MFNFLRKSIFSLTGVFRRTACLIVAGFLLFNAVPASAAIFDMYYADFDSFTTGPIVGQDSWTGTAPNAWWIAGPSSDKYVVATSSTNIVTRLATTTTAGATQMAFSFQYYYSGSGSNFSGPGTITIGRCTNVSCSSGTTLDVLTLFKRGGGTVLNLESGIEDDILVAAPTADVWNYFEVQYNTLTGAVEFRDSIGGGLQTAPYLIATSSNPYGVSITLSGMSASWVGGSNQMRYKNFGTYSEVDYTTHIVSLTPTDGATVGNDVDFELLVYVNPDDIGDYIGVEYHLQNYSHNSILHNGFFTDETDGDIVFLDSVHATTSGYYTFTDTRTLPDGNYSIEARLLRSYLGGFIEGLPFTDLDSQYNQFIVNQSTFLGGLQSSIFSGLNELFGNMSGTTTAASANYCAPFSGQFSTIGCLAFLFVPSTEQLQPAIYSFKENVATHFPLGYATDFFNIVSTTTVGTLTVIDATVPSVLPGAGSTLNLDLTGVFDFVLNATTSQYMSGHATSTETFYQITSRYWEYMVYLGALLYMLGRIVGTGIIPRSHIR